MCSETQFSLRWNNFGSTMTSALNTLQQLGDFVDVTLAAEGVQLKAHKVVLSACSPYFRDILKSNPCQHPVIILREVSIEDLERVLTFMYEGEVNVSQPRLHTFMRLAEALQVKGLTESSSPPSSSSSLKRNSNSDSHHNVDIDESNALSLDLTKRVSRISSPRHDLPAFSSTSTLPRNIYHSEDAPRAQLRMEDCRDSPPVNHASKKRKLADPNDAPTSSALTTINNEQLETRDNTQSLLEVKMEPDEVQDEGKEKGNGVGERNSQMQTETRLANETQVSKSPSADETNQRSGSRNNAGSPSAFSHHLTASDKRGNIVVPRAEKQPASYQPEFPQDPSCHHTLPYPCPFCEKSYTSWGFRRRHIKGYHTGTSELPCKWCLAVLPSHQDWESHVTRIHSLTITDARNGILILEEAHMVLQIAQPTRIDSLMELIKNKKMKDKESDDREKEKGDKGSKEADNREKEKGKNLRSNRGEASR